METGQWSSISIQERKCRHCKDEIGDEFHYLFNCSRFDADRKKYLKRYYYGRPNIIKYEEIMNTNNTEMLKKLCVFINVIMKTVSN